MRDIIVIGSGAGGAVVAKELAARGLDVLVLEAGAHHKDSGPAKSRASISRGICQNPSGCARKNEPHYKPNRPPRRP